MGTYKFWQTYSYNIEDAYYKVGYSWLTYVDIEA